MQRLPRQPGSRPNRVDSTTKSVTRRRDADQVSPSDPDARERAAYRAGFDAGEKAGAMRVYQSPVLENLAAELTLLRTLFPAVCAELRRYQRLLGVVNGIKTQALVRVVELARKLDALAPGWDA